MLSPLGASPTRCSRRRLPRHGWRSSPRLDDVMSSGMIFFFSYEMIIMIIDYYDHTDVNNFHLIVHNGVDINGDVVASQNLKQVRLV